MKTLGEILPLSATYLKQKGISSSRKSAEEVIARTLKLKRLDLYLQFERPLQENELISIRNHLKRASLGEPIEYIFGSVEFYGCELKINPSVLIPRVETEILLDLAVKKMEKKEFKGKKAWDLCTGSGCLGLGLKKTFPDLDVSLSDISPEALKVARANALKNQLDVSFYQGDFLIPFEGQKADFIFCNPPYISKKDYENLEPSVKSFEPSLALVAGNEGYAFYQKLSEELPSYLNPSALIFLEIGFNQKEKILTYFSAPHWKNIFVGQDWSGKNRFFFLEYQ